MKVVDLELLLGVLVSGYFVIEEFDFQMFLEFDLIFYLGLRFMFQAIGWMFEGLRIMWKISTRTPCEYRGMIHGSYLLIKKIYSKYFSFDFDTEQIQGRRKNL